AAAAAAGNPGGGGGMGLLPPTGGAVPSLPGRQPVPQALASHQEGPGLLQNLGQVSSAALPTGAEVQTPPTISQVSAALPVTFVENRGQWDAPVKFVAQSGPVTTSFADNSIQFNLATNHQASVGLTFEGASPTATLTGDGQQSGYYNFFLGDDPSK